MTLLHREPLDHVEKACWALLGLSAVVLVATTVRWTTTTPLPEPAAPPASLATPELGPRRTTTPGSAIRVVAADPFHTARTAPASRYLLPEVDGQATVSGPGALRPGAVRLLGTAVLGSGGGFVMAQVGGATPVTVRIGEVVGDLTLRSITRGEAEFERRDGSRVVLSVPSAMPLTNGGRGSR